MCQSLDQLVEEFEESHHIILCDQLIQLPTAEKPKGSEQIIKLFNQYSVKKLGITFDDGFQLVIERKKLFRGICSGYRVAMSKGEGTIIAESTRNDTAAIKPTLSIKKPAKLLVGRMVRRGISVSI